VSWHTVFGYFLEWKRIRIFLDTGRLAFLCLVLLQSFFFLITEQHFQELLHREYRYYSLYVLYCTVALSDSITVSIARVVRDEITERHGRLSPSRLQ
jgi:hypothetical protein